MADRFRWLAGDGGDGEIIDGSKQDDHLVPVLGFAQGRTRDRLLLSKSGGGSSLHEFVHGNVEDEFGGAGR